MPTASHRPHIRIVQSRQNVRVKELRSGFARGTRDGDPASRRSVSVEGFHLVKEALESGLRFVAIFVRRGDERLLDSLALPAGIEVVGLTPDVFASAVTTESPQGVAALIEAPVFSVESLFEEPRRFPEKRPVDAARALAVPLIVVFAGLQDPGNFGTLVRSAEAFGATGIIALPGTVSQWNPKALRSSAGSAFRLPVVAVAEAEALSLLRSRGVRVLAATVEGGVAATEIDLAQSIALMIGNEGAGLSDFLVSAADERVTIPCPGPVESLNAAVAGSVLLYEAARQRGLAGAGQSDWDHRGRRGE